MKIRLLILVGILACCHQVTRAQETGHPDMIFVPVGIYYADGAFVSADPVRLQDGTLPRFDQVSECMDFVKKAMLAAIKSGSAGGSIVGACMPVRRLDPTGAAQT